MYKLICFDLDGTLTESKQPLSVDMGKLLLRLMSVQKVAVFSGASFEQFGIQFIDKLYQGDPPGYNLLILPMSGSGLYDVTRQTWIYKLVLSPQEKSKILSAIHKALIMNHFEFYGLPFGKLIEDRESQITFSALGQQAPVELKECWNKYSDVRRNLVEDIKEFLPGFDVKIGGLTSIDITLKGINKAFGMRELLEYTGIPESETVYIGDALSPGGNDEVIKTDTNVKTIAVKGPADTSRIIRSFL